MKSILARLLLSALTALALAACADGTTSEVLVPRAASDLRCPSQGVAWETVAPHTYRARGCGAEATYTCSLNRYNRWSCVREGQPAGPELSAGR